MPNFSIGISGLLAAQKCLELLGNNVANAATEGYHRQENDLRPVVSGMQGQSQSGGVTVAGVRRIADFMVEQQLLAQQSTSSHASQTLSVLRTVEASFGQTGMEPLAQDLSGFFSAFSELTTSPHNSAFLQQVVNTGATLSNDFRMVSQYVAQEQRDLYRQLEAMTEQVNTLSERVSALNLQIKSATNPGAINLLKDQRDQAINEMSDLIGIQSQQFSSEQDTRNVYSSESALVTGTGASTLTVGRCGDGSVGLSLEGQDYYRNTYTGGKIGAVLELINHTLPDLQDQLDTLASTVISTVNALHVQGVGESGSFAELTSGMRGTDTVDTWGPDVTAGSFYVRVINQSTGQVVRTAVAVDPSADTLATVAADLNGVANLSASVTAGRLVIGADSGYKFDFLPALLAAPTSSAITGTSAASVSGAYTGGSTQTYSFKVVGSGQVGADTDLHVEVRDGSGTLIKQINVGSGYAAGDTLDAGSGILFSLRTGTLNDGDTFTVQALANSDPTGFLSAAGLNTFFEGDSAGTIYVRRELLEDPGKLAISSSQTMDDADNLARMAALVDLAQDSLGGLTMQDHLTKTISGLGTLVSIAQARETATDQVVKQLVNQRDTISGVDINEESARLLEYERMYQAISRFIGAQNQTLQYLIEVMR